MANIAITGASGTVGRATLETLRSHGHNLTLLSRSEHEDLETTTLDVSNYEPFEAALTDETVLIHLAANPDPEAEWDALEGPNIRGAYNAFEAAVANGLERVVFASSNHAVNMANTTAPTEPETTVEQPRTVRPDYPPSPDTYYGVTKVFGEAMGSYYAARTDLEVVNCRIGWLLTPEELREKCRQREAPGERYARAMWLSHDDCGHLLERCASAPLEESVVTVHGISNNSERFLSLTETMHALEYRPQDDSAAVLAEDV